MTSRERIEAALRHEEPDRTPIFEYVLQPPVADAFLGRPYLCIDAEPERWQAAEESMGFEATVRQSAIDFLDLAEVLGHDMLYALPNPLPADTQPKQEVAEIEPSSDPVERLMRRNDIEESVLSRPDERRFVVYNFIREEMERRGLDLPMLVPAYAHGVWTDIDLMQTMLLEPEVAHKHFELATKASEEWIDMYVSFGAEQLGVGGDFAGNRPLISPACYREFIMPEVRKLSRKVHALGKWAINASDGNLWSVIDDFLRGCEVDGYLEIDMHAGMDLRRLMEIYGDSFTLFGNMDCGNILSLGSEDDVRKATVECLEAGQGNGGHIFSASNAITASVPVRNFLAMQNAYRDFFSLDRLSL